MVDALRFTFDPGHDTFDEIGRVQRAPPQVGQRQAMERERFVEAFLQAARCRDVEHRQFLDQCVQRARRIRMPAVRVRVLQLAPSHDLLRLGEVAHHVLPRVPLTALHRDVVAKHVAYRSA